MIQHKAHLHITGRKWTVDWVGLYRRLQTSSFVHPSTSLCVHFLLVRSVILHWRRQFPLSNISDLIRPSQGRIGRTEISNVVYCVNRKKRRAIMPRREQVNLARDGWVVSLHKDAQFESRQRKWWAVVEFVNVYLVLVYPYQGQIHPVWSTGVYAYF